MKNIARIHYDHEGEDRTMDFIVPMEEIMMLLFAYRSVCEDEDDLDFLKLAMAEETIDTFMLDLVSYSIDAIFEMGKNGSLEHPRPDKQVDELIHKWGIKSDNFWGSVFLIMAVEMDKQIREGKE